MRDAVSDESRAATGPGTVDRRSEDDSGPDTVGETRPLAGSDLRAEFGSRSGRSPDVAPGQSLGRYVILRQLAAGGMSVVYVAYDPELNRQVALKVMRPGGPEGDFASSERLLREAQAMARLAHVNVVHVYDVGVVDQRVYMAMEYVRGETLEEWLAVRTRPWREVISVMARAGRGLAAAHAAGLVHLDFKPRNVLVGDDGEVRVVDFGLARPPRNPDSGEVEVERPPPRGADPMTTSGRFIEPITQYGMVMGTPGYMAAEQLAGEGSDARSDQFAFCVTTWQALYGVAPFVGETSREVSHAVMVGSITAPKASRNVPLWLRKLLERGLHSEPEARHASMDALLQQLELDRGAPLRRVAVGVAALLGVVAVVYGLSRGDTGPDCSHGDEQLVGIWDADQRRAVDAAIRADSRAFASGVADSVDRAIGRWVEQWRGMYHDSCAATHERGEQSAELLDLRTRCLRRHLGELRALTATLREADATTVEHATEAVAGLAPIEECADSDSLTRAMPPLDAATQRQVDAVYDRLAVAVAVENSGNFARALVIAMEALLRAELLQHAPLVVSARQVCGGVLTEFGDGAAAAMMLEQGLLAAERAGMDERRLSIAVELMFVLGMHRRELAQAHQVARLGAALADRVDARPITRARLWANEGAVYGTEGRARESIALYEKALALHLETDEEDATNLASVHLGLGAGYYLTADYERALGHFQTASDLMIEAYGPRHPLTATNWENLGTVMQAMGRYDEALKNFEIARSINDAAHVAPERQATLYVAIAAAYDGLGRYEEAVPYLERVIGIFEGSDKGGMALAVALGNLAEIHNEAGNYAQAERVLLRCIDGLVGSGFEDHIYTHAFKVSLARAVLGLGRIDDALELVAPEVTYYEANAAAVDPIHRAEANLVFAEAMDARQRQEVGPIPAGAAALIARRDLDSWIDDAQTGLLSTGVLGRRPLTRLEALVRRRKERGAGD